MTGAGVQEIVYAGFWRRGAAGMIDFFALCVLLYYPDKVLPFAESLIAGTLLGAIYYIGSEVARSRATPGKKVMGLWVATVEMERMTPNIAIKRYLALYALYIPGLVFLLSPVFLEQILPASEKILAMSDAELRTYRPQSVNPDLYMKSLLGLGMCVATLVLAFFLYCLPIAFTKQKTGLHDWLTKTRVYYGPIPADAAKEGTSHAVT